MISQHLAGVASAAVVAVTGAFGFVATLTDTWTLCLLASALTWFVASKALSWRLRRLEREQHGEPVR